MTPTVLHPEFDAFLTRMAAWYKNGLLDANFTSYSYDDNTEHVAANRVAAAAAWYSNFIDAWQMLVQKVPEATYEYVVLKGPGGSPGGIRNYEAPSYEGWMFSAWTPRDIVNAGVRLQDWFAASKDNYLVETYGVQGVDWKYVDKRTDQDRPLIERISRSDVQFGFLGYNAWQGIEVSNDWLVTRYNEGDVYLGKRQVWFTPDWFVHYEFKGTPVEANNAKAAAFINKAIEDIITNKAPVADWDAKVAEYRAMWADDFIKAATAQYNKAIGKK